MKKRSALKTAIIGAGFLVLSFISAAIDITPTSKLEAILPGLITGLAAWTAIILFIVAIVQAVNARRHQREEERKSRNREIRNHSIPDAPKQAN